LGDLLFQVANGFVHLTGREKFLRRRNRMRQWNRRCAEQNRKQESPESATTFPGGISELQFSCHP
jgi:hypothetical protein